MTVRHPESDEARQHGKRSKKHQRVWQNIAKRWRSIRAYVPKPDVVIAWFTVILGVAALWSVHISYRALKDAQTAAAVTHTDNSNALLQAKQQFRQDARPYIWFTDKLGDIEFVAGPTGTGQVLWTWHYTNYGKSPAYKVKPKTVLWLNYAACPGPSSPDDTSTKSGPPVPPNKDDFSTAVSCPGVSPENFDNWKTQDGAIEVRGVIHYADAYGVKYETDFCLDRLRSGSIMYCAGNDIK